ncbi:MAG: hypothetical protein QOE83_940 [Actinomycetota bacterium]|nr:hypothetical protein [Actinomycetota bacterium]
MNDLEERLRRTLSQIANEIDQGALVRGGRVEAGRVRPFAVRIVAGLTAVAVAVALFSLLTISFRSEGPTPTGGQTPANVVPAHLRPHEAVAIPKPGHLAMTIQSAAIAGTPDEIAGWGDSVWVLATSLEGQSFVQKFDSSGNAGLALDVAGSPNDLVLVSGELWLSYRDRLDHIDPSSGGVVESQPVPMGRLTAGEGQVWGVTGPGSIGGLDLTTMALLGPVDLDLASGDYIVGRPAVASGTVWVSIVSSGGTQLIGVDTASRTVVARIDTNAFPGPLAVGGGDLWLGRGSSALRVDTTTHALTAVYEMPESFSPFAADERSVWYVSSVGGASYDVCSFQFDEHSTDCTDVPFNSPAALHPVTGLEDLGSGTVWIAQYQGAVTWLVGK